MAAPKRKSDQFKKSQHDIKGPPSSATPATGATIAPSAIGAIYKKHGMEIRAEYLEKLKLLAYWQRTRLRDLLDEALREYLEDKEVEQKPGDGDG